MLELQRLSWQDFEKIIGLLLQYEHHRLIREPGPLGTSRGPDYETVDPYGRTWLVEVKHFKRTATLGKSYVEEFIGDIERYQLLSLIHI